MFSILFIIMYIKNILSYEEIKVWTAEPWHTSVKCLTMTYFWVAFQYYTVKIPVLIFLKSKFKLFSYRKHNKKNYFDVRKYHKKFSSYFQLIRYIPVDIAIKNINQGIAGDQLCPCAIGLMESSCFQERLMLARLWYFGSTKIASKIPESKYYEVTHTATVPTETLRSSMSMACFGVKLFCLIDLKCQPSCDYTLIEGCSSRSVAVVLWRKLVQLEPQLTVDQK